VSAIDQERTARKEYQCDWGCGTPILPGDRYVRSVLTPNDNDIGNPGWWHAALHGRRPEDCPARKPQETVQVTGGRL
jgi:hypothetical protein